MMKRIITCVFTCLLVLLAAAGCSKTDPVSEHTLTYLKGEKIEGTQVGYDHDLVGVFFQYTNDSDETCMPCDVFDVKAFQHGKEITVMVFTGQKTEGAIQCDASVQPGMTAEVVWLFELVDHSVVSVECSNGKSYTITME